MIDQRLFHRFSPVGCHPTLLSLLLLLSAGAVVEAAPAFGGHPVRVSYLAGSGAYEPAGDVDWDQLTMNLPLFKGDRILSHANSRVEVELGRGNFLRLADKTDVAFSGLSEGRTVVWVHQGDVILRLKRPDRFVVRTPVSEIKLEKRGLYRIQIDENGATRVLVRKGRAEVETQRGVQNVRSGQQLVIDDAHAGVQPAAHDEVDPFQLWSDRRDGEFVKPHSVSYVGGHHYPGIHELDHYGHWTHYSPHGWVWVPRVSVGWGPFRLGRWGYLSVGWTWLSYEPWGWLPYHHGHWIYSEPHHHWAWVPGGFHHWSPARVNFYFGSGYVGWAPWGYYGGRGRHRSNVVINNTIINNWNPRRPGNGLNVVRERDFGRGSRLDRRITPTRAITRGFREALPGGLENRVRGDRSVQTRRGGDSSVVASRKRVGNPMVRGAPKAAAQVGSTGRPSVGSGFSGATASRSGSRSTASPRIFRGDKGQRGSTAVGSRRDLNQIRVSPTPPGTDRSPGRSRAGTRFGSIKQKSAPPSAPRVVRPESDLGSRSLGQRPQSRGSQDSSLSSGPRIVRTPSHSSSRSRQSTPRFGRSRSSGRSSSSLSRRNVQRSPKRSGSSTFGSMIRSAPRSSARPSFGRSSRSATRPSVQRSSPSPSRGSSNRSSSRSRRR